MTCKRFMMRVYPKGIRVSSSNLDPAPFWRMGAQIVALNWQYINAATMLNQAMFHATGGWVLKPEGYRSFHRAQSQITALDRGRLDLTIELLAGQDIGPADKKLHLYVRSELHIEDMEEINGGSLPEGGSTKEGQIKAVAELGTAGRSPDFGRQMLQFKVDGVAEELTFVRYVVLCASFLKRTCPTFTHCLFPSRPYGFIHRHFVLWQSRRMRSLCFVARRMALPKTLSHFNLLYPHALYGYMHAHFTTCCSIDRAAGSTSYVALDATLDSQTRWPGSMMRFLTVTLS